AFFEEYFEGTKTNINRLRNILSWTKGISDLFQGEKTLIEWFLDNDVEQAGIDVREIIRRQKEIDLEFNNFILVLKKYGPIDIEALVKSEEGSSLDDLISALSCCEVRVSSLINWAELARACKDGETMGLKGFIDLVFSGHILAENARSAFEFYLFSSMASEIIKQHPSLSSFTRVKHQNTLKKYAELDKDIIKANRDRAAYRISRNKPPRGTSFGKISSYTEMGLLKHLTQLKKISVSIRNLMDRSCNALKAIKPCFMMSPISVSQYLVPEEIDFDLVIMDEASQIRPVDALGAILRANQVVVVGDSKQLPPTSFFDTILFDEEEDEEDLTAVAGMESILDVASSSFPKNILRWHYRSEHENLIKFSNDKFYDNELIVCSSPYANGGELGVRSHYISGAKYKRGRNTAEAQAVVDKIIEHFEKYPKFSLGVATFNKEQRDHIEDLLEKRVKEFQHLEKPYKEALDADEPFFIKNLENVQGDERDIIFISTVYGPDRDTGTVFQRFGPIAGATGWRRLNVIFTRAKKRVEVFTSLRPSDIREGASSIGPTRLREYLEYAETGILTEAGQCTGEEPDSDFEISVLNILKNNGIKALPQIGVSGFKIDIGVLHPYIENEYILGIECDGAAYHSSKIARDRDRLREEILVKKGWTIHRIWSTDWFKNRDNEEKRLLNTIKDLTRKIELLPAEQVHKKQTQMTDVSPLRLEQLQLELQLEENNSRKSDADSDMRKDLVSFRKDVIGEGLDEPSDEGILREEVLDFFVLNMPVNTDQFYQRIPRSLRERIKPEHVTYLDKIFDIIKAHASL
ncbi:MAG: very-short-patch-repair endonuclease, partial [Nitrospinales bacterium]